MDLSRLLAGVRRNWNRPSFWRSQFHSHVTGNVHDAVYENDGVRVIEEDWDNLIVLDACRYDAFERIRPEFDVSGRLEKRTSRGSMTREYLEENFPDDSYPDVVYVTANPFVDTDHGEKFCHVENVWVDGWDEETETVMPNTVLERALEVDEVYPSKRLIVHFMQPHNPFVGESKIEARGYGSLRDKALGGTGEDRQRADIWELLGRGVVSEAEVRSAYEDNLRIALSSVATLCDDLTGKTVVTSDHGNVFGDRAWPVPIRVYGHEPGVRIAGLVDVPWLVTDHEARKEIHAGVGSSETESIERDVVDDRLEALGYT